MNYRLRHRTRYRYESPVSFAQCVLRLTPRTSAHQSVFRSQITISPPPARLIERIGPYGEATQVAIVETPHTELVIEANSRVAVHVPACPEAIWSDSPDWHEIRELSFQHCGLDAESPAAFLFSGSRTPLDPQITDYARQSFLQPRPILVAAIELMQRIHSDFRYDTDATQVSTAAKEAFASKRGVCQDFAHVMITGLRGLGLPAAYVSGYLRTLPPAGQPRMEGADASHAWVSVWCGSAIGWIGLDPTNRVLTANDHVTLAIGRDYADIAPIDGIILASGDQSLKVEVDVIPE